MRISVVFGFTSPMVGHGGGVVAPGGLPFGHRPEVGGEILLDRVDAERGQLADAEALRLPAERPSALSATMWPPVRNPILKTPSASNDPVNRW